MGSGCGNNFSSNSCAEILSSNCIKWEGEAYSTLDICINDTLTEVLDIALGKIKDFAVGKSIIISNDDLDFEDCEYLSDILDGDGIKASLIDILNTYMTGICDTHDLILSLTASVADFTTVSGYTLDCITVTTDECNPVLTFKMLIQAIIDKVCSVQSQIDSISDTILDVIEDAAGNFIQDAITSCSGNGIVVSGTGASTVITFQALVPPYAPILYTGTLSYFDIDGIGITGTPMCGWYLCNGDNGTPNSTALPQNDAEDLKYIIRFT